MGAPPNRIASPLPIRVARRALHLVAPRLLRSLQEARQRARFGQAPARGPKRVLIEATTACNYRCLMCTDHGPFIPDPTRAQAMPWDRMERLIREVAALGAEEVWLAGRGEPLLHPQAKQAITLIGSLGMRPIITTNASQLTESLVDELCQAGLGQLSVSLNAGTPETYAQVNGVPAEGHDHALAIIRRASQRPGPPCVIASMVLLQQNAHEILDFTRNALAAGVHMVMYLGLRMAPLLSPVVIEDWDSVRRDLAAAEALAKQAGVTCIISGVPGPPAEEAGPKTAPAPSHWTLGCYVGHLFTRVLVDGSLRGCCSCEGVLGSLAAGSFVAQWHSRAYREFRGLCREMPSRQSGPPACNCADCGNTLENGEAYLAMGFQPAPRNEEDAVATRLELAELVWRHLADLLPGDGSAPVYTDLTPEQAGPTWAAVAGLHAANAMTGVPEEKGRSFRPGDLALRVQATHVLRRSLTHLGLPADRAEQLVTSTAPDTEGSELLFRQEIDAWAQRLRAALPKTAAR